MDEDPKKDEEEHELNKLRLKKLKSLMDAKKKKEDIQKRSNSMQDKIDFILKVVLQPDAYQHLMRLKEEEPNVYNFIFNELVSPDVLRNIDYLISIIQRQGGVPRRIPKDVIILLERKAKGTKSSIKVKRGDDIMDLGSYLKK